MESLLACAGDLRHRRPAPGPSGAFVPENRPAARFRGRPRVRAEQGGRTTAEMLVERARERGWTGHPDSQFLEEQKTWTVSFHCRLSVQRAALCSPASSTTTSYSLIGTSVVDQDVRGARGIRRVGRTSRSTAMANGLPLGYPAGSRGRHRVRLTRPWSRGSLTARAPQKPARADGLPGLVSLAFTDGGRPRARRYRLRSQWVRR